jgi:hypothetical protein
MKEVKLKGFTINQSLIEKVYKAVYIDYKPSKAKIIYTYIIAGISEGLSSMQIANDLCEYFQIEKRNNRAAIAKVINNSFNG